MAVTAHRTRSSKGQQLATGLTHPAESLLRIERLQSSNQRHCLTGSASHYIKPNPGIQMFALRFGLETSGMQMDLRRLIVSALRLMRMEAATGRDRNIELAIGIRNRLAAGMTAFALAAGNVPGVAAGEYYLRTGLGFDKPNDAEFRDVDHLSARGLYGCCAPVGSGIGRRSLGGYGSLAALELGAGYDSGSVARYEFLVDYRPEFTFSGVPNYNRPPGATQYADVTMSSISAMVAAFVDLDRIGFSNAGPYRPLIGAGIGAVRNTVSSKIITWPPLMTIVPGGSHVDKAWMVTTGFSVALDDRVTFDFAWRYTDLGEVQTGTGEGRVVRLDGTIDPILIDLLPTWARLRGHGIRLSLRHSF